MLAKLPNEKHPIQILQSLEHIVFGLNQENIESSVELTLNFYDAHNPISFHYLICNLIYSSCVCTKM